MNSKQEHIVKLNDSNFYNWKFKMELLLTKEDLWGVIEYIDAEIPSRVRALSVWNRNDKKAKALIGLNVEDSQFVYIRNCRTAKETWKALKMVHERDTIVSKVQLYKKISRKRLNQGENLPKYINELDELFQQLCNIAGPIAEEWKIGILLGSLSEEYDHLVTALELRPDKELTWNLVQSKLNDHFMKMNENKIERKNEQKIEKAEYEKNSIAMISAGKSKIECFFCKKGHKLADCDKFKIYKEFEEFSMNKKHAKCDKPEALITHIHNSNESINFEELDDAAM